MKTLIFNTIALALLCFSPLAFAADAKPAIPAKIVTPPDFRELLLHTKWTWKNVTAGIPDRECVFMADGTFRHPHFVAKFTIKDMHTVELAAKGKHAEMTFDADYKSFEAIDFEKHRITGQRK